MMITPMVTLLLIEIPVKSECFIFARDTNIGQHFKGAVCKFSLLRNMDGVGGDDGPLPKASAIVAFASREVSYWMRDGLGLAG